MNLGQWAASLPAGGPAPPNMYHQVLHARWLEKHAFVFLADLGKEIYRRRPRIGNESESMAGTRQRCHCDVNRRGILDESSSKLLDGTTVGYPSKDSRPLDIQ